MKKQIDAFDYAGHICKSMKKGVLLTTKSGDTVNTMTIGWGKIGIEWNKAVFIAYVRETRYTKQLLEQSGIVNASRYRSKNLPTAGALLKEEDSPEKQISFEM